jgi:hypothetical protein
MGGMIEKSNELSVEYVASILKDVAVYERSEDGQESGTIYSNVYDLTNGHVHIYYKREFQRPIKFTLEAELSKGNHGYLLRELFKR